MGLLQDDLASIQMGLKVLIYICKPQATQISTTSKSKTLPNVVWTTVMVPILGGFPKEFDNTEGFEFGNCDGQMYEFPILTSGNVYGGGRPFEFRVIYQLADDGDGKYCGLVYHPVCFCSSY